MTPEVAKDIPAYMAAMGAGAKTAARELKQASAAQKNDVLQRAADFIDDRRQKILAINEREVAAAQSRGLAGSFIDRMSLDNARIDGICDALKEIAAFEDPVGKVIAAWTRPNGLEISRVRTPIGVIAVIYESRPNVTVDAAAIALKAGNAVILRSGSDCLETADALFQCMRDAVIEAGLPAHAVQFVNTSNRDAVGEILAGLDGNLDLIIPRGGKSLVARVQEEARAPVLSHLDGICHVYVDRDADMKKAIDIIFNSKMRRTGVCGAAETVLIDREIVDDIWPLIAARLRDAGCELRGDRAIQEIDSDVAPATEDDWHTEYLAPILSVAVVDGNSGALAHIASYSSGHTETIVTENEETAAAFINGVDSAIVLHNASTQFADGGEFGLGAEIGIATGQLHARGPVGVEELTTYKNVVRGTGQIRP